MRFSGKLTKGQGSAGKRYPWKDWSMRLAEVLGRGIALHRGTLNMELEDPEAVERLLQCRLGQPVMRATKEEDKFERCFHEVRVFHGALAAEGVPAFLWRPEHRVVYRRCVELAAETIKGLELGDKIEVDFSAALDG